MTKNGYNQQNIKEFYEKMSFLFRLTLGVHNSHYFKKLEARRRNFIDGYIKHNNGYPYLLDLGCGGGGRLIYFAQQGVNLGLDLSMQTVKICEEKCVRARLKRILLVVGDAAKLPLHQKCLDFVVCCDLIEHVVAPGKMPQEINRCLKPGGTLILVTPNAHSLNQKAVYPLLHLFLAIVTSPIRAFRSKNVMKALNEYSKYVFEVSNEFSIQQHYHEFSYKVLIDLIERNRFSLVDSYLCGFIHDSFPHQLCYTSDGFSKVWNLFTKGLERLLPKFLKIHLLRDIIVVLKKE